MIGLGMTNYDTSWPLSYVAGLVRWIYNYERPNGRFMRINLCPIIIAHCLIFLNLSYILQGDPTAASTAATDARYRKVVDSVQDLSEVETRSEEAGIR
jgi:hypothetical protein